MIPSLTRAGALVVSGGLLAGCSVLLDWADFSDGAGDADTAPAEASTPEAGPDAAIDSGRTPPACTSTTCMGCCSSTGDCQGGESANSCGAGGQTCQNCESTGLACVGSACVSPATPHDAGMTTACTASACKSNLCIPEWQSSCCKSDGTCGCQVLIPAGPCM